MSGGEDKAAIESLAKLYEEALEDNKKIIQSLFIYIQEKSGKELASSEKSTVIDDLYSYMLDDGSSKHYMELISAFLIENKDDENVVGKLKMIKEGIIMYSGLKYDINPSNLDSWDAELTIFLDTEILFSACGYNGTLFKELFEDFYSLVKEINSGSQGRKIHLKYFRETQDEIESFFIKAEQIVKYDEKVNPAKTAMLSIIDGVKVPSDVILKKTMFYEKIKGLRISLDTNENYYNESQYSFNLEDEKLIGELCEEIGIQRSAVANALELLSHINVLREGNNSKSLEDTGYVFMTQTTAPLRAAWNKKIKKVAMPRLQHLAIS